jgi:hypothetical protein
LLDGSVKCVHVDVDDLSKIVHGFDPTTNLAVVESKSTDY